MTNEEKIVELYLLNDEYKASGDPEILDKADACMGELTADNSKQCIEAILQFITNTHSPETNLAFGYLQDKEPEAVVKLLEKKLNSRNACRKRKRFGRWTPLPVNFLAIWFPAARPMIIRWPLK